MLNKPGLHGALSSDDAPLTRLLITEDHVHDELAVLLPVARAGVIDVFAAAERCAELVDGHLAWRSKPTTAMICRDLRTVPDIALPGGLLLRPVRRLSGDAPDGVPLEDAVAVAVLADPAIDVAPAALAAYLRSSTPAFRLFAAVDNDGAVRATSGFGLFGSWTKMIFVNTDPGWRLRGIGRAMTAVALRAAEAAGARQAGLDASNAGLPIYQRLGFETVTRMTRFSSPD